MHVFRVCFRMCFSVKTLSRLQGPRVLFVLATNYCSEPPGWSSRSCVPTIFFFSDNFQRKSTNHRPGLKGLSWCFSFALSVFLCICSTDNSSLCLVFSELSRSFYPSTTQPSARPDLFILNRRDASSVVTEPCVHVCFLH